MDISEYVVFFSIESGFRKIWNVYDIVVIEVKFSFLFYVKGKKVIISVFFFDEVFSRILERGFL